MVAALSCAYGFVSSLPSEPGAPFGHSRTAGPWAITKEDNKATRTTPKNWKEFAYISRQLSYRAPKGLRTALELRLSTEAANREHSHFASCDVLKALGSP